MVFAAFVERYGSTQTKLSGTPAELGQGIKLYQQNLVDCAKNSEELEIRL